MVTRARKSAPPAAQADALASVEYPEFIDSESLSPALEAIKAELGIEGDVDCAIHVSLLDADGEGNEAKVWQGNEIDYNLEALARKFGSGRYRIMGYVKRPDGSRPRAFNRIQGWRLSPEDQAKYVRARQAAENPPPEVPAQTGANDMRDMLRDMMAGFKETLAAALKPQVDPLQQMQQLAAVMKTLMPSAPAVAAAPDTMQQLGGMLTMLKTLKEVTGGNVPEGASASDTLLLEAARALLPSLANGLQKQTGTAPSADAAQPAQAALPAPPASAPGETSIMSEDDEMQIMQRAKLALFQVQLNAANRAASRGVKADDYAETIYGALDDDDINNFAFESKWFEMLCEAMPACAAHKVWYAEVRERIILLAVEDGILERDAAGGLTVSGESGTSGESKPGTAANGPAASPGNPASALKP